MPTIEANEPNPPPITDELDDSGATTASDVYSFTMVIAITRPSIMKQNTTQKMNFQRDNNLLTSCNRSASLSRGFFSY